MVEEGQAGWLNSLAELWASNDLDALIIKLVGLLLAMFAMAALFAMGARREGAPVAPSSAAAARRSPGGGNTPAPSKTVPAAKNRKKQPEKTERRYRPQSRAPMKRKILHPIVSQRIGGRGEVDAPGLVMFVERRALSVR